MTILRLFHAGICSLFGYSAFIAFIVLKNYPSAILGIISGVTDSVTFFLHYLLKTGRLRQWYSPTDLRGITRYAIFIATLGLLCLGYYTTIQIIFKTPILPVPTSNVISIVWSFIAMRSGLMLMYYSILYQNLLRNEDDTRALTEESEEPVVDHPISADSDEMPSRPNSTPVSDVQS